MTPERFPDTIRILHLEDSLADHDLVHRALRVSDLQFDIFRVDTLDEFIKHLRNAQVDVILADYRLPGFTAIDAWQLLQTTSFQPPFILLSGAIGEAAAVEAIKLGFTDYLLKDNLQKLSHVIFRAIEINQSRITKAQALRDLQASEGRLAEFANHLQDSIEQERAAIAREVHDDIGGSLAAANLDLAWISRRTGDPAIQAHVTAAIEMIKHALGASQRIMLNLRPAILDQGLSASVQWLIASFEKRTGIKTRLQIARVETELSKAIQLTAYRTAQEALTNISKYAHCSLVTLELSDTEGMLTLEITDNGQGISNVDLNKPSSFGLKGLRERAKSVGGWLDISTQSDAGTSIILSIPLSSLPSQIPQEHHQ